MQIKKSLYRLKQALCQWYRKFDSFMVYQNYARSALDHCAYVNKFDSDDFIIMLIYVDDMLIVGRDKSKIENLKKKLNKSFHMKDLGHAR